MATLEITKAKSRTPKGIWFTFIVEEIRNINGTIFLLPQNLKYKSIKLRIQDCIIIK